jgi:Family of unknown function (DUF5677)
MPTRAPTNLIDRDVSRAGAREAIDLAVPVLQDVVDYGSAALARCLPAVKDGDQHLAILISYRHLLEMVDAVQVLVEGPTPRPAALQLRSAFEALLTIEFILQADTERRAFAYLARHTQSEVGHLWRLGGQHDDLRVPPGQIEANLRSFQRRLERPGWKDANAALLALGKHRRLVNWYSAYGGPKSTAQLAAKVGRTKDYNVLYGVWSGVVHAGAELEDLLKEGKNGEVLIRRLRHPDGFNQVVSFAVDFAVTATRRVLVFYRPAEEKVWAKWYRDEIRERARSF